MFGADQNSCTAMAKPFFKIKKSFQSILNNNKEILKDVNLDDIFAKLSGIKEVFVFEFVAASCINKSSSPDLT